MVCPRSTSLQVAADHLTTLAMTSRATVTELTLLDHARLVREKRIPELLYGSSNSIVESIQTTATASASVLVSLVDQVASLQLGQISSESTNPVNHSITLFESDWGGDSVILNYGGDALSQCQRCYSNNHPINYFSW